MVLNIHHLPGRTLEIENETFLFFSGTSYLGVGHQTDFRKNLSDSIFNLGTIFSASRNGNLRLSVYEDTEKYLAQQTGAAAALTVTSGALAGQVAVTALKDNFFIYATGAHPAIWKTTPEFVFSNEKELEIILKKNSEQNNIVIACNAVDPLTCLPTDWSFIKGLPNDKNITLLIDDSHGIGVTGKNGNGIYAELKNICDQKLNLRLIVVASLAKACGIPGGVILGERDAIKAFQQLPLFVGASPIVPAYLEAFLRSSEMYDTARAQLFSNCAYFLSLLSTQSKENLRFFKAYPVFFVKNETLYAYLYKKNIFISHFAYPKPDDPPITRIIISALHTQKDILTLAEAVNNFDFKN